MSARIALIILFLAASAAVTPAHSQGTPPAGARLTDVVLKMGKPDKGIVLVVGRWNALQPNATLPPPGASPAQIARAFGLMTRRFGAVLVIAPPTMSILNPHPTAPDPYQDLEPKDALKLLIASLTAAQWQALTGDHGLGIADLEEKQQGFFKSLFPGGALRIQPQPEPGVPAEPYRLRTLSAGDLLQARLRLTRTVRVEAPTDLTGGRVSFPGPSRPGAPRGYVCYLSHDFGDTPAETQAAGIILREVVPNVPKRSALDYHAPRFAAPVPLDGLKTVGDLMARIGKVTGTELYADHRFEIREMAIAGTEPAVPAEDLLPAVAFCLTGTYRRVGPAFVLTDDLVGAGTRREILESVLQSVEKERSKILAGVDAVIHSPIAELPLRSDSVEITPGQLKSGANPEQKSGLKVELPFDELTPEQQQEAQNVIQALHAQTTRMVNNGAYRAHPELIPHPTMEGKFALSTRPSVLLQTPALDAPADLDELVGLDLLFDTNLLGQQGAGLLLTGNARPAPSPVPLPRPDELLKQYSRRAILAQPRSLADVDAIIAAMPRANLNELWLVVPRPGEPQKGPKDAPPPLSATELVDRALDQSRNTGIRVLPALDLLYWGKAAPADAVDYTILGENSAQVEQRQQEESQRQEREQAEAAGRIPPMQSPIRVRRVGVSPFAPSVASTLSALERAVIRPGIAGLVWRDPALPGYVEPDRPLTVTFRGTAYRDTQAIDSNADSALGYVETGRLAFLRQTHVDPVDINPGQVSRPMMAHPMFDDAAMMYLPEFDNGEVDRAMRVEWRKFRQDADVSLLRRLYAVDQFATMATAASPRLLDPANAAMGPLPVLVEVGGSGAWFGNWFKPWDDPRTDPPGMTPDLPASVAGYAASAHPGVPAAIGTPQSRSMKTAAGLSAYLKGDQMGGHELVFDLAPTNPTGPDAALTSLERLNRLIQLLHTAPEAAE